MIMSKLGSRSSRRILQVGSTQNTPTPYDALPPSWGRCADGLGARVLLNKPDGMGVRLARREKVEHSNLSALLSSRLPYLSWKDPANGPHPHPLVVVTLAAALRSVSTGTAWSSAQYFLGSRVLTLRTVLLQQGQKRNDFVPHGVLHLFNNIQNVG